MNEPTEPVGRRDPSQPGYLQYLGRYRKTWRHLIEGTVGPMGIVVVNLLLEAGDKVVSTQDDHPVEALRTIVPTKHAVMALAPRPRTRSVDTAAFGDFVEAI